jgi:acyl carrier protein
MTEPLQHELMTLVDVLVDGDGPESVDAPLRDLEGYNSLFLAGFIDAVEDRFSVEIPAEMVLPDNFRTVRAIASLVAEARSGER